MIHPSVGWPADIRAALTSETIPANTGADAEVPDKIYKLPPIIPRYFEPRTEISGYPLPMPYPGAGALGVLVTELKYPATADFCHCGIGTKLEKPPPEVI